MASVVDANLTQQRTGHLAGEGSQVGHGIAAASRWGPDNSACDAVNPRTAGDLALLVDRKRCLNVCNMGKAILSMGKAILSMIVTSVLNRPVGGDV